MPRLGHFILCVIINKFGIIKHRGKVNKMAGKKKFSKASKKINNPKNGSMNKFEIGIKTKIAQTKAKGYIR